jgi:hypothetical protein
VNLRQDRFLLSILAGIVLLVLLSLVLFFVRQGAPAYGPEDTPQGVLQNYVVALTKEDYQRAFGYVAGPPGTADPNQSPGLPDFAQFQQFFLVEARGQIANTGLQIGDVHFITADSAAISITVLHTNGSLFNSVSRESQQAQLVRQNGAWKLAQGPYPFWSYAWSAPPLIHAKPVPPNP